MLIQFNKITLFRSLNLLFIFTSLLLIEACGVWTNFKTYFNTYYNAQKIFETAETELLKERTDLFYYEEKRISNKLSGEFDKVIEKTSSILQHNKESDFVDESLLMTGKSFYYQQNYSRALRKFNELVIQKDSEYELENLLWIGKTYLQLREFNKALNTLKSVKEAAIENEEDELLIDFYRVKIGYLIYNEDYSEAVAEINDFLETDIDDELRAEVYYEMGLLYKLTGDLEKAWEAFMQVENYSPSFSVEYSSKFEAAKLKKELGEIDEGLELLEELRDEDKYSENWDEIDLEIGLIFYRKDDIEGAIEKFTIVDTTYENTEASGIAAYYRAEILENFYHDYDSALVIYKNAGAPSTPEEYRFLAQKKSGLLNKYITYHETIRDLDTQKIYILYPEEFIEDSLEYVRKVQLDSIKNVESGQIVSRQKGSRSNQKNKFKEPVRPKIGIDSLNALHCKNYFELANLLFSEFDDPDSAYYYYNLSLEAKKENPNEAQTYFAIGNYFLIKEDKEKADSMFTLVYDKFEFDPIRNEAAKILGKPLYDFDKDPVEEKFLEAEEIYESRKYYSAINKLYSIYENNPKSIYASKSLYTIGFILENNLDMPDSAAAVYGILNKEYKTSEYAKAIQIKYSGYQSEQAALAAKQDSTQDSKEGIAEVSDSGIGDREKEVLGPDEKVKNDSPIDPIGESPASNEEITDELKSAVDKKENEKPEADEITKTDTKPDRVIKPPDNSIEIETIIISDVNSDSSDIKIKSIPEATSEGEKSSQLDSVKDELFAVSRDIFKGNGKYYVQVSSWKTKEIAEDERKKLKDKDYNAIISEVYVKELESLYYRVRVGPYDSIDEAKSIRMKFHKY